MFKDPWEQVRVSWGVFGLMSEKFAHRRCMLIKAGADRLDFLGPKVIVKDPL